MANTYVAIATVTVGSGGAATMSFSSIPSTYTDLLLKVSARSDGAQTSILLEFNGATTNRSTRYLYGDGSSVVSATDTTMYLTSSLTPSSYTANTFGNAELYIPNYAGSNNKSSSVDGTMENNATLSYMAFTANLWSNTSAITSITLRSPGVNNFAQYSTATLYGIKNS